MVENPPSAIDLQEFQFKLHSKLKIFDSTDDSKFKNSYNLVAAASRYGLVFVGTSNNTFEVIQLKSIENCSVTKTETTYFPKRTIQLHAVPSHLTLNCDQTLLAVVCYKNDCATAIVYNVASFLSRDVAVCKEIRLSATPGVKILEAGWNPTVPGTLTACKADGSLGVYNISENSVDINELPIAAAARCFCWSPKGKQIVVGSSTGCLTQYKPELKAVKVVPAPSLGGTGPYAALAVCWISNYQYAAVFKDTADEESRPSIVIVNAPKTGPNTYINYDDVCYSNGNLRMLQYYIIYQPTWGVLLVSSANSMEVGVLGLTTPTEPALWTQWNQLDAARAELPLSTSHQETLPVGVAFDTGATFRIPWGESNTLSPMPYLHLLSHHGVLCSFSVINIKQGAPELCSVPENLPETPGLFVVPPQTQQAPPPSYQQSIPILQQPAPIIQQAASIQPMGIQVPAPNLQSSAPVQLGAPFMQPVAPAMQPVMPTLQIKQQPTVTTAPNILPTGTSAPNFSSLSFTTKPAFGATPAFSSVSLPSATSAPTAPGALPGWNSGSTLFGGAPNFSSLAMSQPQTPPTTTTTGFSFKLAGTTPTSQVSQNLTPITQTVAPNMFGAAVTKSVVAPIAPKPIISTPQSISVIPITSKPLLSTPKPSKPEPQVTTDTKKDETVITDQMIQSLIKEEMKTFQSELQELFIRCKNIKLDVGTEDEKTNLVLTTESLLEFYKELQETTDSQVAEIHYLKQVLMQSFAWYEDTKARHKRYTDPNFASLLQAQELDPVSEKQLADIKHLIYYIEAQLKQVDSFLDNQWADFQDSCKKQVKGRLQIPTLEPIYQSLVRQNAILDRQKYVLKDIAARIKSRNKKSTAYPNIISLTSSKTIEIDEELRKLKLDHGEIFSARYDKVLTQNQKFSQQKQSKLCSFFTNRNVYHISPKKPKFINHLMNTPLKFQTSPKVQRNLAQTFNKIDSTFNNSVEANLSASNLFSFTLLDAPHSTKLSPEKPKTTAITSSLFNSPKPDTKITTSAVSNPIFNFTATNTVTTQSKPLFGTGDGLNFTQKPIQVVSKPPETKESKKTEPFSGVNLGETVTTQPFVFTVQNQATAVSKPSGLVPENLTVSKPSPGFAPRDSIEPGFAFGALSLGQQSTPKPKVTTTELNFSQLLSTTITTSTKPVVTTATTQVAAPKPSFGIAQPTTTTTSEPVAPTTTNIFGGLTKTTNANAVAFSLTTTANISPFSQTTTTTANISPFTTTSGSIFGGIPSTPTTTNVVGSFFGAKPQTATTGNIFGTAATPKSSAATTGFSFTQAADGLKSSSNIFGGTTGLGSPVVETTPVVTPTTTKTGASSFSFLQSNTTLKPDSTTTQEVKTPTTPKVDSTSTTTQSSFGFGAMASSLTTTTASSSFSFGNLTINALSPSTTTSTVTTSAAAGVATGFSFTLAGSSTTSTAPNTFGAVTTISTPTTSISSFGGAISSSSPAFGAIASSSQVFGATSTENATVFGAKSTIGAVSSSTGLEPSTTATTPTTPVFASSPTPSVGSLGATTPSTTTFGAVTSTTSAFGAPTTTPTASVFGATSTTTASTFGNFGASLFGKPATTTTTTTTASFLGQPICSPSSFTQPSVFGQNTGNIFAQKPASPSASTSSIFGQSSGSIFGQSPAVTTASNTSIFGQTQSSPFGAPITTSGTSGSIFGQTATSGSIFGQSSFGSPAATSSSSFSFTQNTPSFGTSGGSIFGAKPSFGSSTAFGAPPAFGGPPAFGANPTGGFGSPAATNQQQSGSFGSGFGSPSAFGQKPAFGSPPSFGQNAFGSPPAFGTSPSFGSPQRVFGSPGATPPQGAFGSAVPENSTFANLASQPTIGFGSLVQNQPPPQPQQPQFSGGAQFSSWR